VANSTFTNRPDEEAGLRLRKGPQPRLSRQVPRRSETAARSQPTLLRRSRSRSRRSAAVRQTHAPPAPSRLVVYAKQAFGGPMQVLRYLGRYTHRVAISNHRLLAFEQEHVTFRWKDYATVASKAR
jgi:Putative transposase